MLSVFRVTSLCHTVTLVSRCLPVPGVSRTECHSPGPRSARSVSPGPALSPGVTLLSAWPAPVTLWSRDQFVTRATPDIGQPAPAGPGNGSLPPSPGCSAHLRSRLCIPGHTRPYLTHPGHWSPPSSDDIRLSLHFLIVKIFSFFLNVTCRSSR